MTAATSARSRDPAGGKVTMRRAILTEPILPTLAGLALPTIAVLVAQTIVGVVETYYVSRLGTDALVGVSVVFPIWMLMTMMSAGDPRWTECASPWRSHNTMPSSVGSTRRS